MNLLSVIIKSHGKRSLRFTDGLHLLLGIGRWLVWFFTVTEEDQMEAGIYVGQASRPEE